MNLHSLALLLVAGASTAAAQDALYVLSPSPTSPQLLQLDPVSGAVLSSVAVTGHEALFGGLAIDFAGAFWSIDGYNDPNSDRTFRIDPATGAGTVVGDTGHNWNFRCVCSHPLTDELYGWRDNQLYTIDRSTGAATSVAQVSAPGLDQATALAISPAGVGYLTDIGDNSLFELDLATASATFLGNLGAGGGTWFHDLDFDSAGVLWGSYSPGDVYRIDVATATAQIAFTAPSYRGLAFLRDHELGTSFCSAVSNSTGFPSEISATGSPAAAANAVVLSVQGLPVGQPGYFLAGQTQGSFNPPGSQGLLCLAGNIGRYNRVQDLVFGPSGSLQLDLTAIPVNPPRAVLPGDTWNFQVWHRDVGGTNNFSDGVSILFF